MAAPVQGRKPYVRPMAGWWKRDPFFVAYMWREATALGVMIYAVVLACGVLRLAQGEAAWNGWLEALKSPPSLLLHAILLVAFVVHAKSWFEIMPKTMPMMHVGGQRVAGQAITRAGILATVAVTVVMLGLAMLGARG
jgi:fumarate reductase subunit C